MGYSGSSDKGMKIDEKNESSVKTALKAVADATITALLALCAWKLPSSSLMEDPAEETACWPHEGFHSGRTASANKSILASSLLMKDPAEKTARWPHEGFHGGRTKSANKIVIASSSLIEGHAEETTRWPHEGFHGARTASANKSVLASSSLMEGHAEETARRPHEGFHGGRTASANKIVIASSLIEGHDEETACWPHEEFHGGRTTSANKSILASSSLMKEPAEETACWPHEGFHGGRTTSANESILASSSLMKDPAEETACWPHEGFHGSRTRAVSANKSVLASFSLMEDPAEETAHWPHERFHGGRTARANKSVLASSSLIEGHAEETAHGPHEEFGGNRTATANKSVCRFGSSSKNASKKIIKIMTYNVWLREDVEINARMEAISDLIAQHKPDVIFFQEVTPNIRKIFEGSKFWGAYRPSLLHQDVTKRSNSTMLLSKLPIKSFRLERMNRRDLPIAEINISNPPKTLIVATSHLPKQSNPKEISKTPRKKHAKRAINIINCWENVVFGGDMNWVDASDGPFPLLHKWVDAWEKLHPKEDGWTYDTKTNAMLKGRRTVQERLDRFLCKLKDFRLVDLVLIGSDPIPGVSHWNQKGKPMPVYPSDHYGLLLTIELK